MVERLGRYVHNNPCLRISSVPRARGFDKDWDLNPNFGFYFLSCIKSSINPLDPRSDSLRFSVSHLFLKPINVESDATRHEYKVSTIEYNVGVICAGPVRGSCSFFLEDGQRLRTNSLPKC